MIYTIVGEQPFQVLADTFSVSPSESGYDLYLSADGINYSNFASVSANVTRQFTGMNNGNYYKLVGNSSTVKVNWERDCHSGGGGGGGSVVSWQQDLSAGTQIAQITINGASQAVFAPEGGESGIQNFQIVNSLEEVSGETTVIENTYSGIVLDYSAFPSDVQSADILTSDIGNFLFNAEENNLYDWFWNPLDEADDWVYRIENGYAYKLSKTNKILSLAFLWEGSPSSYAVPEWVTTAETSYTHTVVETTYPEGLLIYKKETKSSKLIEGNSSKYMGLGQALSRSLAINYSSDTESVQTVSRIKYDGDFIKDDVEVLVSSGTWQRMQISNPTNGEECFVLYNAKFDEGMQTNIIELYNTVLNADYEPYWDAEHFYFTFRDAPEENYIAEEILINYELPFYYKRENNEWKKLPIPQYVVSTYGAPQQFRDYMKFYYNYGVWSDEDMRVFDFVVPDWGRLYPVNNAGANFVFQLQGRILNSNGNTEARVYQYNLATEEIYMVSEVVIKNNIAALSQADYDALVQAGTVDPSILYVII